MTQAQEIGQNLQASNQKLEALLGVMDIAYQRFEELLPESEARIESLQQMIGAVDEVLDGLVQTCQSSYEQLNNTQTEITEQFNHFQETISSSSEQVAQVTQNLTTTHTTFETELTSVQNTLNEASINLSAQFEQLITTTNEFETLLLEGKSNSEVMFNNFGQALSEGQSLVEILQEDTENLFSVLMDDVQTTHIPLVEIVFENFSYQLAQEQKLAVQSGFGVFEGDLTDLYTDLEQTANRLGDDLQSQGTRILDGVTDHFRSAMEREVKEIFQDVLDGVVDYVFREIMENFVLMQVGQATTSALSGIMPYLAAAKVGSSAMRFTLENVNDFL